jgi:hypothetical protein
LGLGFLFLFYFFFNSLLLGGGEGNRIRRHPSTTRTLSHIYLCLINSTMTRRSEPLAGFSFIAIRTGPYSRVILDNTICTNKKTMSMWMFSNYPMWVTRLVSGNIPLNKSLQHGADVLVEKKNGFPLNTSMSLLTWQT